MDAVRDSNTPNKETAMVCATCHSYTPNTRTDVAGNVVEQCTEPVHAGFAAGANETYRDAFRAKRQAELKAACRAPKSKAISRLYFELTAEEYDEALHAVGLTR